MIIQKIFEKETEGGTISMSVDCRTIHIDEGDITFILTNVAPLPPGVEFEG